MLFMCAHAVMYREQSHQLIVSKQCEQRAKLKVRVGLCGVEFLLLCLEISFCL